MDIHAYFLAKIQAKNILIRMILFDITLGINSSKRNNGVCPAPSLGPGATGAAVAAVIPVLPLSSAGIRYDLAIRQDPWGREIPAGKEAFNAYLIVMLRYSLNAPLPPSYEDSRAAANDRMLKGAKGLVKDLKLPKDKRELFKEFGQPPGSSEP
eukprot:jgi/Bigna1/78775/fgenesh1_pg.57_\